MIFLTPEVYKQIEDLKKKIQAQILKIAKDAYVLNSDDFQIQFELIGHTEALQLGVYIGGTNEKYSNLTVILHCYIKVYPWEKPSTEAWQEILNKLIEGQRKLRELKKQQVAEAKKAEAL
ncbi:TPA: hypothetical protein ACIFEI_002688 [Acinetobacter nosocomialis]